MRSLSMLLWLVAYGAGLLDLAMLVKSGPSAATGPLLLVCAFAGAFGIVVDRIRMAAQ